MSNLRIASEPGENEGNEEQVWTPEMVCDVLKIDTDKLYKLNVYKVIPYFKVGRHNRYLKSHVLSWFVWQDEARNKSGDKSYDTFPILPLSKLPNLNPTGRWDPRPERIRLRDEAEAKAEAEEQEKGTDEGGADSDEPEEEN